MSAEETLEVTSSFENDSEICVSAAIEAIVEKAAEELQENFMRTVSSE